jgi:hypothetical protein
MKRAIQRLPVIVGFSSGPTTVTATPAQAGPYLNLLPPIPRRLTNENR